MILIQSRRPRARRYPCFAKVELTDLESATRLKAEVSDLSLFGCHVSTATLWPVGTRVRIRIAHNGASFAALAKVAYVQLLGMGVVFTSIDPIDQSVLDNWIAALRARGSQRLTGRPRGII